MMIWPEGTLDPSQLYEGAWRCRDCGGYFRQKNLKQKANNVIDAQVICDQQVILLCPFCKHTLKSFEREV